MIAVVEVIAVVTSAALAVVRRGARRVIVVVVVKGVAVEANIRDVTMSNIPRLLLR